MNKEKIIKISPEDEISNVAEHGHRDAEAAIGFYDINFSYGKKSKVLGGVTLEVKRGTFTSILGPNGSGKSTLVKALMKENFIHKHGEPKGRRVLHALSGKEWGWKATNTGAITVNGKDLYAIHPKQLGKTVAYIPQLIEIPEGISVVEFVGFGRIPYLGLLGNMRQKDKEAVEAALKKLELYDLRFKDMRQISGGQRQKALVAMALAQETEIIVLDEPTTFLDIKNQHEILNILSQLHLQGKTILAILHDVNQAAQYSDYIYLLKDGHNYAYGSPEEVINEKNMREVYGISSSFFLYDGRRYISNVKVIENNESVTQQKE